MGASGNGGSQSFWTTLPGVLTGLAAIITAIGTVVGVLLAAGVLPVRPGGPTPTPSASTPTPTITTSGSLRVAATWTLSPNPLAFGNVKQGTAIAKQAQVTNIGTVGTLTLASFRTVGDGRLFGISTSSSCFEGQMLGPSQFCMVSVVFYPPAGTGFTPYSNQLTVTASDGSEQTIALTGSGLP